KEKNAGDKRMFGMKNMGDMMKLLAQKDKIAANVEAAKAKARTRTTTADAGAGMVKVTANGMGEIVRIEFDAEALKDGEALGALTASNGSSLNSKSCRASAGARPSAWRITCSDKNRARRWRWRWPSATSKKICTLARSAGI